jgi:hypothetical protein
LKATVTTTDLADGLHGTIAAAYSGDGNFKASVSRLVVHKVKAAG